MLVGAFLLSVSVALGPQRLQPEGRLHVVQTLQAFSLALAFVGAMRSFAFIPINRTLHPAPLHTSRHASDDRHRIGEQDRTSDMPSPIQPCRTHRTGHMPSHCPPGRTRPSEQPPEHAGQQVPGDQPADHGRQEPDEAHHVTHLSRMVSKAPAMNQPTMTAKNPMKRITCTSEQSRQATCVVRCTRAGTPVLLRAG